MASNGVVFWTDQIANPDPIVWSLPPDPWSVVYMGSNLALLPGLLDNGDVNWRKPPHRVVDKGRKPSTDGANPKFLGFGCAEFDLKMVIHDPFQLGQLQTILPQIFPHKSTPVTITPNMGTAIAPGNGIPGAQFTVGLNLTQASPGGGSQPAGTRDSYVLVYHPALTLAGITQCIVEKWTPPVRWQGKNDVKMYVLHCLEYRDGKAIQGVAPKQLKNPAINNKVRPTQGNTTPPSQGGSGPAPALG